MVGPVCEVELVTRRGIRRSRSTAPRLSCRPPGDTRCRLVRRRLPRVGIHVTQAERRHPVTGIGNLKTRTDARGVTVSYSYDLLNRLTAVDYPDESLDVSYSYDAGPNGIGRLTGMTDASGNPYVPAERGQQRGSDTTQEPQRQPPGGGQRC